MSRRRWVINASPLIFLEPERYEILMLAGREVNDSPHACHLPVREILVEYRRPQAKPGDAPPGLREDSPRLGSGLPELREDSSPGREQSSRPSAWQFPRVGMSIPTPGMTIPWGGNEHPDPRHGHSQG